MKFQVKKFFDRAKDVVTMLGEDQLWCFSSVTYHKAESNSANQRVEDHDGPTDAILVANPSSEIHPAGCGKVWRCDEALGSGKRETHLVSQNDGQEVGHGVCNGRQTTVRRYAS
jgi:hypothetical protein